MYPNVDRSKYDFFESERSVMEASSTGYLLMPSLSYATFTSDIVNYQQN